MGHQTQYQAAQGRCHFTQCSCGRGVLKVGDKVLLLSSSDVKEITRLFAGAFAQEASATVSLSEKLNDMTGHPGWRDFSVPQ